MDKFVRLRVLSREEGAVDRIFNTRYIRQVQPDTLGVWLNGSMKPMKVSEESMRSLIETLFPDEDVSVFFHPELQRQKKCLNRFFGRNDGQ